MPWDFDYEEDRMDDDNREDCLDSLDNLPDYTDDDYFDDLEELRDSEDDGQPSEYDEWQDLYGGDDWDNGQYDTDVEY